MHQGKMGSGDEIRNELFQNKITSLVEGRETGMVRVDKVYISSIESDFG